MRIWAIIPLALLILARPMKGQDTLRVSIPPQDTLPAPDPYATRKVISAGLAGAIALAVVADSYYSWWRDAEKPFSFYTEGILDDSHLGLDKLGHLFGSYAMFKSVHTILSWGGYRQSTALGWALGVSIFHGLSIEIGDGFSQYGFDYQDLLFDFAGTAYGYLQAREPFFENFDLKFSYWSGQGLKSPANFTQDYDAMTIWLSFNIHNLLPAKAAPYWPGWLNLAVGYGVGEHETQREFLVSLDLNFKGFSTSSQDVAAAEKLLDLMHFPAPGVKFTPSGKPTYSFFLLK